MTEQKTILPISRRNFLQLCGLGSVACAMGSSFGSAKAFAKLADAEKPNDGWYPGLCKMCMQGDCIQRVHVVDGVVVELEGDERAPSNKGTLCARGNASIMNLYNPWRVKAPMKRTNSKKGRNEDPGWVEISWEEAFATVSEKMKAIRKDDPRKLVTVVGFGSFSTSEFVTKHFTHAFGSPNLFHTHGQLCSLHFGPIYTQGVFPSSAMDMERMEYTLSFGMAFGPNRAIATTGSKAFVDAVERGAKIVIVDPRCSVEASKASQWIPIKVGTDCAFLLAMLHSVLYEIKKFDVWFVKNRTNGPYLIGPDGYYVRDQKTEKPLLWDEVEGKARPFDEIPPMNAALEGSYNVNGIKAIPAFQLIKESVTEYTPEWAEGITTVPAKTIRQVAEDFIHHAHIGQTVNVGGVTMPFTPVGINYQRGAYQHQLNGPRGDLVARILCELAGAFDVPGGLNTVWFPNPMVLIPDKDGVVALRHETVPEKWEWPPTTLSQRMFYPVSHTLAHIGALAITDPEGYHMDYTPEMILTHGGNPGNSISNPDLWEKVYSKIPFSVAICETFDDTALMADILMPNHAFMERDCYEWSINESMPPQNSMEDATHNTKVFGRRDASAIKNPFNTLDGDEIIYELADRVGILKGPGGVLEGLSNDTFSPFPLDLDINRRYTKREISEARLKKVFVAPDKTLDDINDESGPLTVTLGGGPANYNYFFYPENKTRHPMYMMLLKQVGDSLRKNMKAAGIDHVPGWKGNMDAYWKAWQPLPTWAPNREQNAPPEYDLNAFLFKTVSSPFRVGNTIGNPYLYETFKKYDPYDFAVWINAKTAREKGLKDGDQVIVESRYGSTQARLKTTELIHPQAVGMPGARGGRTMQENPIGNDGPFFNAIISGRPEDGGVDPITGGIACGPAVKIFKA